ncbi:alcohol oxidase-like protein [Lactarius hengduanensis]|nr:alcohol oxidase-like protein [Lactarius hengduanensis]
MSTPTAINEEYDIVIAGGGTAACVVAGRLAAADANLRVLLLEAGPTTYDNPAHTLPLNIMCHLVPGSRTTRAHISQPSAALGGRTTIVPCGQCLGGGGSINFMMYTRPSASDFDDWKTVYQNPGWGSKDLIPLLKKIETYQVPGGGPTHGTDGPLAVSPGGYFTDLGKQFLQVARILDPDRAQKPDDTDSNDLETINVYTRWLKWINAETGTRSDVPHNMIYPLKDTRPNLHFLTGVHVKHVTFDDENRATGVAYTHNPLLHPEGPGDTRTVRGTKLVLVSAGTFGSPGILERSGIGTKDVLDSVGVRQRVDLPGVGENYQDHSVLFIQYFAADEAQSLAAIFRNEEGAIDVDAGIKWRPKPSEVAELGPEFQEYWDSYFANAPDKPVLWMGISSSFVGDPTGVSPRKYYTLGFYNQYPLARGHVHITHADDVSAPTDFVPGFFESQAEVRPLTWGYKFLREIARRMPHFRGEPPMLHPKFAPGGPASVIAHAEGPVPFDAPRIVYSEEDERALEEFARAQVADLSVPPGNVSANTYGTALVIGEKAAVIIAEDLGIKGVV